MNKVEKIKAEIERRIKSLNKDRDFNYLQIKELEALLSFSDSLEEEPVSIDFEQELYKAFGQVKDFTLGMQIAKWFYDMGKNSQEPVSEELSDAANDYVVNIRKGYPRVMDETDKYIYNAFKAGAQWQKQQDQSTIELAEDHAYLAGQEQIIDKACEWLKSYRQDTLDGTGYISGIVNDKTIEEFKQAMEE